jgi:hypothetical protein
VKRIAKQAIVLLTSAVVACGAEETPDTPVESAPTAPEAAAAAPPPPPVRRTLPDAEPAGAPALAIETLEKVDLAGGHASGEVTIAANDARVQTGIAVLSDGNLESLVVGSGINPLELTITLRRPIRLRAARVFPAGSPYDWVLEPMPGQERLIAQSVPERAWSQIDLAGVVETSVVRLEILRLERDDYVHVNEIELYVEPAR